MRAVVTGGGGFIGSHLVEALVERGDEVLCIERPGARPHWLEGRPVRFEPVGIEREDLLRPALRGADVVFHLAALTEARSPAELYAVNTEGTRCVLQAAAAQPLVPRVVLVSSLAALGPCRAGEPLSPDTVPCPLSHYGQSKLLAEATAHAFSDRVPVTVLRFPSVYGPRERAVLTFFRMVRRGIAVSVGPWDREVSMLYATDAVQALLAAADTDRAIGRTYCVAHPESVSWRRFAEAAGRALGRMPLRVTVPPPAARVVAALWEAAARMTRRAAILNRDRVRELIQARWVCDPSRAIVELGFQPRVAVEQGTEATVAWCRQAGWL
jgi:nucleoside-diphosphate-sugar epimerase